MVTTAGRPVLSVASTGEHVDPMAGWPAAPVLSTTILANAADVEHLLECRVLAHAGAQVRPAADGAARLGMRAWAEAWAVPPGVVWRVDRILHAAANAESAILAAHWCQLLPDEILKLLERRGTGARCGVLDGPDGPHRRVTDRPR